LEKSQFSLLKLQDDSAGSQYRRVVERRNARGIHILTQHQTSCFLQTEVLLKLERAHRGHGLEVMVKTGLKRKFR
jgi:hypothetical protein